MAEDASPQGVRPAPEAFLPRGASIESGRQRCRVFAHRDCHRTEDVALGLDVPVQRGGPNSQFGSERTHGNGAQRIYELLNTARPVLLNLSCATDLADSTAGWADRTDTSAGSTTAKTT